MENELSEWGRLIRTGVSGLIFVALLVGGGAAALTALAAGLNALSGGAAAVSQQVQTAPATAVTRTLPTTATPKPKQKPTATQVTQPQSQQSDVVTSPIGDAIDSGGVVIGNGVQTAFGHVLSRVLDVLFMEQNGQPTGGTQP